MMATAKDGALLRAATWQEEGRDVSRGAGAGCGLRLRRQQGCRLLD